jgi:imidazolonepropionase-like amidohydrolase
MIMRLVLTLTALLALPSAVPAQPPLPAGHSVSVLHCAHLFDPVAGRLLGETTVVVEDGHIRQIQPGAIDPTRYRTGASAGGAFSYHDLSGQTCMPGLIDAHTHLTLQFSKNTYSDKFRLNPADYAIRSTVYAKRTLLAGFTTVRNVGDEHNESIALRNAVNAGIVRSVRRTAS